MGANDETVIARLNWMRDVLGPILREAMQLAGEIDLRLLLSQALHMGDECHNRNVASTTILIQKLAPFIMETSFPVRQKREVFDFVACSDYFSGSTCRNGVEFGIRISGIPGHTWFAGPAQKVIGPMFAGYKPEDSGLDIGDSAITETYGIGGFTIAAARPSCRR
jgi:hypothetical protein